MFKRPQGIDSHYFGRTRTRVLIELLDADPMFEYRIGDRHVGAKDFRHEYANFEIVGEYRPDTTNRRNRYAIYARYIGPVVH